jgi:hypothetical protein
LEVIKQELILFEVVISFSLKFLYSSLAMGDRVVFFLCSEQTLDWCLGAFFRCSVEFTNKVAG